MGCTVAQALATSVWCRPGPDPEAFRVSGSRQTGGDRSRWHGARAAELTVVWVPDVVTRRSRRIFADLSTPTTQSRRPAASALESRTKRINQCNECNSSDKRNDYIFKILDGYSHENIPKYNTSGEYVLILKENILSGFETIKIIYGRISFGTRVTLKYSARYQHLRILNGL